MAYYIEAQYRLVLKDDGWHIESWSCSYDSYRDWSGGFKTLYAAWACLRQNYLYHRLTPPPPIPDETRQFMEMLAR